MYQVQTETFEGPLDLLLQLIEKKKLFVNDVSLAQVTDDYIEYVNTLQEFPTSDIAHFILVASTLLLIKSKSLLPILDLTEEEKQDVEDLERRLKIYKRIQELTGTVKSSFGKRIAFERPNALKREKKFAPAQDATVSSIGEAIRRVLTNLPKKEFIPKTVVQKVISLEEVITDLTDRVKKGIKMSFNEFTGERKEKVNVIVGFLALLELVKQGVLDAKQEKQFDDIHMESQEISVPNY